MRKTVFLVLIFISSLSLKAESTETVRFASEDGLQVTADLYLAHPVDQAPFIILFHQAGWSRGEYLEIAPRLNKMGFNCMAVDQRSGGQVNNVVNETAKRAKEQGLAANYPDALPDMLSAIAYVKKTYSPETLLLWGSSYSSALVLKVAGDRPGIADGVLAFAPGEYFVKQGMPDNWITTSAGHIEVPVFITSAREEKNHWKGIFKAIPGNKKFSFLPKTDGNHGSRALWSQFEDAGDYWEAVERFLKRFQE
ncbi:alpha/beta hydrolase [Marinilabiliaceae bacterium JC017]|nr:alpha/beta hydrolase [Marinilabiliaceae bacterium JC017]